MSLILEKLNICNNYQPKFGTGKTVTLADFKQIYGQDAFYSWFGLDNPMLYAAHRAAGGITSIYRQLGIACEVIFQQILQDELELLPEQVKWIYEIETNSGTSRKLSLDGRIVYEHVKDRTKRDRIKGWVEEFAFKLGVSSKIIQAFDGVVFEIRQGYKSKDSKRQNADISNITSAYARGYFPVFAVLSMQIDNDVAIRYKNNKCAVLVGSLDNSSFESTYAFCEQVLGYDLADFFKRNSQVLRKVIGKIIETLLESDV